jgi:SAM-dependent methyltransferase
MLRPLPFPPSSLRERVFAGGEEPDSTTTYDVVGQSIASAIERHLPDDFTWESTSVLDFACGAGRVLRHLITAHPDTDWWCCDIHEPSIAWLQGAAGSTLHAIASAPEPPLPIDNDRLGLVYGISAFTHLGWDWASWLAEMHRILKPGGLLMMSLLGPNLQQIMLGAPLADDELGLLVCGHGNRPENNGATVFHSEWWVRAHWGRAFEIVTFVPDAFVVGTMSDGTQHRQSMLVARARDVPVSPELLLAPEPNEPRELAASQLALNQTVRELDALRLHFNAWSELPDTRPVATIGSKELARIILARTRKRLLARRAARGMTTTRRASRHGRS